MQGCDCTKCVGNGTAIESLHTLEVTYAYTDDVLTVPFDIDRMTDFALGF